MDRGEINSTLGKSRLLQYGLIAATLILAWVAEIGRRPGSDDWTWRHWLVAGGAVYVAWVGFRFRRRLFDRSGKALAIDASDIKAFKQWKVANGFGLYMAFAVGECGLVVRMVLGGGFWQASLFYAASLLLLLIWTPRAPVIDAAEGTK